MNTSHQQQTHAARDNAVTILAEQLQAVVVATAEGHDLDAGTLASGAYAAATKAGGALDWGAAAAFVADHAARIAEAVQVQHQAAAVAATLAEHGPVAVRSALATTGRAHAVVTVELYEDSPTYDSDLRAIEAAGLAVSAPVNVLRLRAEPPAPRLCVAANDGDAAPAAFPSTSPAPRRSRGT